VALTSGVLPKLLIPSSPEMSEATSRSAGIVTSSTSMPYFAKMPCSFATHSGATLIVVVFSPHFRATRRGEGDALAVGGAAATGGAAAAAAGAPLVPAAGLAAGGLVLGAAQATSTAPTMVTAIQ
jgi:hypothetical protein